MSGLKPKHPALKTDKRVQKTGKGLRILRDENVLEMAMKRMHWLWQEFWPNIMVSTSGGKDSTVVLELAIQCARERDQLPVDVLFIDQEAEWQATVDMIEITMARPEVRGHWLQVPLRISNGTSRTDQYLDAWNPEKEDLFCHPYVEMSEKDNVYGTDRFYEMFVRKLKHEFGHDAKSLSISGMRSEEAPTRRLGFGFQNCYKWITWGGWVDYNYDQYLLSPIYDWSYTDVWKAIHEHGWNYNRIYDQMYQRGESPRKMRVSHLHHEQAINSLFMLQELEPVTYERLVNRIEGIHMAATMGKDHYYVPKQLPYMFDSWLEYRDYLLANLIDDHTRPQFEHRLHMVDRRTPPEWRDFVHHSECNAIVINDMEGVAFDSHIRNHQLVDAQKRYVASLGADPWGDKTGSPTAPNLQRAVGAAEPGPGQ